MSERDQTHDEARAERDLQQARDIFSLASMPGWKTWLEWIATGIENRRDQLCSLETDEPTTNRLRGEIMLLRQLYYAATKIDAAKIREIEASVKGLRIRAEMMHDVRDTTRSQP